jgi:hypothetical protein
LSCEEADLRDMVNFGGFLVVGEVLYPLKASYATRKRLCIETMPYQNRSYIAGVGYATIGILEAIP